MRARLRARMSAAIELPAPHSFLFNSSKARLRAALVAAHERPRTIRGLYARLEGQSSSRIEDLGVLDCLRRHRPNPTVSAVRRL